MNELEQQIVLPHQDETTAVVMINSGTRSCHVAVMQLLEELRVEHDLIDRMLDSFRTAVSQFVNAQTGPQDLDRFVRFFRVYADQFHHSREEQVLFATLVNQLHLPGDHGPIAVLTDDHRQFKALLDQIEQLIARQPLSPADQIQLRTTTERYITAMQHHIDAENSVLFVEGGICLQEAGISELPSRPLSADEQQVRFVAEELLQSYPPTPNVDITRGDGCVLCPAYQTTCDGYEREWPRVSRWGARGRGRSFFQRVNSCSRIASNILSACLGTTVPSRQNSRGTVCLVCSRALAIYGRSLCRPRHYDERYKNQPP